MFITENFLSQIKNGENVFYLIEFICTNDNLYFTTNDKDIIINNIVYKSNYIVEKINHDNIENINDFTIKLLNTYNGNHINIEELLSASINIKIATKEQNFVIFSGYISNIELNNDILSINISSKIIKLTQTIGQLFSPLCRECFGSEKCGININNYKTTGKIIKIISQDCVIGTHQDSNPTSTGYYQYGLIKFLSGKLAGITMKIKDENNGKIYLLHNTTLLSINDEYEIFTGCDKTLSTCKNKFNNVVNFRGEPYINN